jgi:exopolysaccharide biosynthesis polyprenyl glycosylphosphotransferase
MTVSQEYLEQLRNVGGRPAAALPLEKPYDPSSEKRRAFAGGLGYSVLLATVVVALLRVHNSSLRALTFGLVVCGICVVARYVTGRAVPRVVGRITRAALGALLGVLVVLIGTAWFPEFQIGFLMLFALAVAAFTLSVLSEGQSRPRRILLVGSEGSTKLLDDVARHRDRLEVVAIVDGLGLGADSGPVPLYGSITDLTDAIQTHRPDLVVINVTKGRPEVFQALLDLARSGFRVVGLPELYEHAFGRVPVAHLSPAWFMSLLHLYQRPYTGLAKRTFDVLAASIGILITLPLLIVIPLFIRRPILYRQVRVGEWGRVFTMYKFRTMRNGAEENGVATFAAVDDPRVTRVGRILRKTRLDELPQLWNVLIGDMSVVGPRPERPEFFFTLAMHVPWWTRRNMVKPGITGWAQINSGYAGDVDSATEKLSYDLWYLRHRNLLIDLIICLRTVPKLVIGTGAR